MTSGRMDLALGIRCSDDGLAYVVLRGTRASPEVVASESLTPPKGGLGSQLGWVRAEIHRILQLNGSPVGGLKTNETPQLTKAALTRSFVEGVAIEAAWCAPSGRVELEGRRWNQVKRDLGLSKASSGDARSILADFGVDLPNGALREAAIVALCFLDPGDEPTQ